MPIDDEWVKTWFIYTTEYFSALKGRKSGHGQRCGWTWRAYYAKRNKLDLGGKTLPDSTLYEASKPVKLILWMLSLTFTCQVMFDPFMTPTTVATHPGEGNGTPLQYSCLENSMDRGAWKAAVHGVDEGRTRLSDFTFTFHFPALEKEMATHSTVLAWRIPGTAEPDGLPSMGSHRVGHDWSDLAAAIMQIKVIWISKSRKIWSEK